MLGILSQAVGEEAVTGPRTEQGGLAAALVVILTPCLHGELGEVAWHTVGPSGKTEKGKF